MKAKDVLKVLVSLWIVYHLVVIVVLANNSSYVSRNSAQYLIPYGNILGLNSTWNFFSPDPAHTMYIEYKVRFDDPEGNSLKDPIEGFIPPQKEKIVIDSSQRRFLYAMRFLLLDPNRLESLMGPWLCRRHPGASEVSLRSILESLPTLDVARTHLDIDVSQLKRISESQAKVMNCRAPADEVSL